MHLCKFEKKKHFRKFGVKLFWIWVSVLGKIDI